MYQYFQHGHNNQLSLYQVTLTPAATLILIAFKAIHIGRFKYTSNFYVEFLINIE